MKTEGTGFTHFLDGKELTEEELKEKIKNIKVNIEVDNKLVVKAKTVK
jgi:hypothetical protein